VSFDTDRLVRLWNGPLPPDDDAALADVRAPVHRPGNPSGEQRRRYVKAVAGSPAAAGA
jgi:hypothetical protein